MAVYLLKLEVHVDSDKEAWELCDWCESSLMLTHGAECQSTEVTNEDTGEFILSPPEEDDEKEHI